MGTYTIPRNLKGETRLLMIFSIKSLISTAAGAAIGGVFFLIIGVIIQQKIAGLIIMALFALIGYAVGTFKIPTLSRCSVYKKNWWGITRRDNKKIRNIQN